MENLILALDCSLRRTNAAVFSGLGEGGEVIASESLDIGRRQAAELPLAVERVLAAADRRLEEVGLVAVTNGPGYFTGLRVGASYAMALAYGLGVGVVPVPTLRMLACPYTEAGEAVLVLVYAGRGRVYAASFGCGERGKSLNLPAGEYALAALESWLSSRAGQETALVSDDPQKAAQALGSPQILGLPVMPSPPNAGAAARIARRERETAVEPMALRISYLREPQIG
ncbi:MAG: tRNA (adenosine(37)-N6)-threonylcarbamoyltransferase complex dimerization subunit type 1 TsaB [Synergistaceae bacterium]|jgi:tRNA threonylcarbamoyladenosine biosynthesis protein TsaB|nr:tRNA (adenosine(37)-N6)-threonylcarbamoyltransferase complex dimerization subunit type 1 TsaB [Synergistaceae bacterium]